MSISECEIEDFDPSKPLTIEGYKTFFPLQREGCNKKRLLCFVKSSIEVTERTDLMHGDLSSVWLEVQGNKQKIFISTMYREFSNLVSSGQMSDKEQKKGGSYSWKKLK